MEYIHLMKDDQHKKIWNHSFANELVRLAQGIDKRVMVTDTIFFVNNKNITSECRKDITYVHIVVEC